MSPEEARRVCLDRWLDEDGAPSQAELAARLGKSQALISQWRSGATRITFESFRAIAAEFKKTLTAEVQDGPDRIPV